jgi:hypothetical protein
LIEPLSSKTAHIGDPVTLELAHDIRINDVLLVREGAKAVAVITAAKKAGRIGQGGDLALEVSHVKVGDTRVKLRGVKGEEGASKVGTTIALTAAVGVFGLPKRGKNAELPAGSVINAFVAEDVALPPMGTSADPVPMLALRESGVNITSDPEGAEIEIDGAFIGNTPTTVQLAAGPHKIKIVSDGRVWERTLRCKPEAA